jgi:hypothetical protein
MTVPRFDATVLPAGSLIALALAGSEVPAAPLSRQIVQKNVAGMWRSADGAVRLDLRPDGDYERGIAGRRQPSHGSYLVDGPCVLLQDDNGLRTVVTVAGDLLEMAGHQLYKV